MNITPEQKAKMTEMLKQQKMMTEHSMKTTDLLFRAIEKLLKDSNYTVEKTNDVLRPLQEHTEVWKHNMKVAENAYLEWEKRQLK